MDGLENFKDLQGNNVNDFIKNYRDTMKENYADNVAAINQQRRNDYASIMSQANKAGMMYSNFPERTKMQYDTETYLPHLNSAYQTYQTGLDKLRSNALSTYNNIKETQAQIDHLNSLDNGDDDSNKKTYKWGSIINKNNDANNQWFYNDKGSGSDANAVRFSTWARHNDYDDSHEGYMKAIGDWLSKEKQDQISKILGNTNMKLKYNANGFGETFNENAYDGLSDSDRELLASLGLMLGY